MFGYCACGVCGEIVDDGSIYKNIYRCHDCLNWKRKRSEMRDIQRGNFIREMIAFSMLQRIMPNLRIDSESIISIIERRGNKELYRIFLESHPSIKSKITDKDMILCRIDWALENGDKNLFINLTNELKKYGTAL